MFRQGKDVTGYKYYSFLKRLCSFVIICKCLKSYLYKLFNIVDNYVLMKKLGVKTIFLIITLLALTLKF